MAKAERENCSHEAQKTSTISDHLNYRCNALNALLYMLPLHQIVQLEAEKSALRIIKFESLFGGDLKGHLSILKRYSIISLAIKNEDWMEKKNQFQSTVQRN